MHGTGRGPRSALRWLAWPFAAARVFTGAKSFGLPVIGDEALNRRGLHVWRTRLAHRLAEGRRRRLEHLLSAEDRAAFARDGVVIRPGFLPRPVFDDLVREVLALVAPAREMREGGAVTRRIAVTRRVLAAAPALRAFVDDRAFQGLARYVASFDEAPVVEIQTVFGAPPEPSAAVDPQTSLHMDTFHPAMKAWFFLHDVADDEGPFTYVKGSHRLTPRRMAWQRRQSVLASSGRGSRGGAFRVPARDLPRLGWRAPHRFAVPGNTLVVGDTFGFHARAASPAATMRVEIYATSRPNPFKPVVGPGLDRVPWLGDRRSQASWWVQDRLAALGLGRVVWRDVGAASPGDPRR